MQSLAKKPDAPAKPTIMNTLAYIYKENGVKGLYRGVTPRIGLGIWQTVCMVSFADYVKAWYVLFCCCIGAFLTNTAGSRARRVCTRYRRCSLFTLPHTIVPIPPAY